MEQLQSFDDFVGMLRRHVFLIVVIIACGIAGSVIYATSLPRLYETSAVIQIEQPRIRDPLGSTTSVNAAMLQQLQIIEQRVMSRNNLQHIIDKYNLFSALDLSDSMKVDALRESASVTRAIDPSLQWRPDVSPTALTITVRMANPELGALVANELVTNVLEQNQQRRSDRVRETLEFFESEEARVGEDIDALESEIAVFKTENADALPAGMDDKREQLASLREAELEIDRQIIELNTGGSSGSNSIRGNRVLRLEEQRALFRQRAEEIEAILDIAPQVEQTFNTLERRLQKLSDQYQAITRSQAEAEMGQMLESSRQSESFTVLERALVPALPISPNRKRIVTSGTLLSMIVAIVSVLLLELRNPVIRTASQLERQVGIRAIVAIPVVEMGSGKMRQRVIKSVGMGLIVLVAVLIVGLIIT